MNKIVEFVKQELENDYSGHNFQHIERVVKNAQHLIAHEGGNYKIIVTACYLHDLVDSKLFTNIDVQISKIISILEENGYLSTEIEEIIEIIQSISFSKGNIEEVNNLNLEIVRDADRLDALGAIGIIRTIEYGNSKKRKFYEEDNLKRFDDHVEFNNSSNTSLSHFYEKLLQLKDYMHTYTAKKIAEKRTNFLLTFLDEFYEEIK